jgi:hypothetical protein
MNEESGMETGEGRQFEWLLDINYVLLIMMIFVAIDVYFSFVFNAPLCKANLKVAYEVIGIGHIAVFLCLFSAYYAFSIKLRKWFFQLTCNLVSPLFKRIFSDKNDNDEILNEYFVDDEELLEYALQTDSLNLYAEVKEHENAHFRFIRVCELTFSIGILLLISMFSVNSTLTTCSSFLGIFRWILVLPVVAMILWGAHAPCYNEKKIYVGKTLVEKIRKMLGN